jgi:hypothetical protein
MSIKTAIYAALSPVAATYAVVAEQGAQPPWIRYQGVAGVDMANYDGDGMGATSGRIQVDAFALDYGTAERMSRQARAALYSSPGLTVGEITDNPDDYEGDTKLFRVSFDVTAWE